MGCCWVSSLDWCLYFSHSVVFLSRLTLASYAELGTAIPLNGGAYAYLHHIFGPLPAFLFSWTAITALKPGSSAIIAIIFAEYINRVFFLSLAPNDTTPIWADKLVALACIWLVAGLNAIGSRWGTIITNVFTLLKLITLAAVAIIGIVVLGIGHGAGNFSHNWFEGSSTNLGNYALALYSGLWAYDGISFLVYANVRVG
jgi:amino acid transporter